MNDNSILIEEITKLLPSAPVPVLRFIFAFLIN